jgi:hypothetical protein
VPEPPAIVRRLADALAEGTPVDWASAVARANSDHEVAAVRQLQRIAELERLNQPDTARDTMAGPSGGWSWGDRALVILALGHVGIAWLSMVSLGSAAFRGFLPAQAAIMTACAGSAVVLLSGGRGDRRAVALGQFFTLVAAAVARPLLNRATDHVVLAGIAALWHGVYAEAFLGAAAWNLARVFPLTLRYTRVDRVARRIAILAAAAGVALFVTNVVLGWWPGAVQDRAWLGAWQREDPRGRFWDVTDLLLIGAVVTIAIRSARASARERSRVVWLGGAIALGFGPLLTAALFVLLFPEAEARFRAWPPGRMALDASVLTGLLLTPVASAYVVIAERLFAVRLVIRRALRYLLARYTLTVAIAAPLAWLAAHLYALRARSILDLWQETTVRHATWAAVVAALLLIVRPLLLRGLDRVFLGRRVPLLDRVPRLAEVIGRARTPREAADGAAAEIIDGLGLDLVAVLAQHEAAWTALHGHTPAPPDGAIVAILREEPAPVWLAADAPIHRLLPPADRGWIDETRIDSAIRLVTPAGAWLGILAVGERHNRMPLGEDERRFLGAAAATIGLTLDGLRRAASVWPSTRLDEDVAAECDRCGAVTAAPPGRCACGGLRGLARLPLRIGDKFELVRCLGRGGMGVVYLARDLRLGRFVALKTLPVPSDAAASAMFDEARAMAAVEHPSLALIFGVEVWQDTPVLVAEYLPNGTLAAQLRAGPLALDRVIDLGAKLADALVALHERRLLHRDIKPSNIGFNQAGAPKLLDFGLVRLLERSRPGASGPTPFDPDGASTSTSSLAGTPLYLPPEAMTGDPPDVANDLWGLALVLFESAAGTHPFLAPTVGEVFARVQEGRVDDIRRWCPDASAGMAAFFARALHVDGRRRFDSAAEFGRTLRTLQAAG